MRGKINVRQNRPIHIIADIYGEQGKKLKQIWLKASSSEQEAALPHPARKSANDAIIPSFPI